MGRKIGKGRSLSIIRVLREQFLKFTEDEKNKSKKQRFFTNVPFPSISRPLFQSQSKSENIFLIIRFVFIVNDNICLK